MSLPTSYETFAQLPAAIALTGTELVPMDQGGVTKAGTPSQFVTLALAAITQAVVAAALWPPVTAEGSTVVNKQYIYGVVDRYGTNTTQGTTDMTTAVENALAANKQIVLLPGETYLIDWNVITLPVGAQVYAYGANIVTPVATTPSILWGTAGTNRVYGGNYTTTNDWGAVVGVTGAVSDVKLFDVKTTGARLLRTDSSTSTYSTTNDANSPSNVETINCTATAATVAQLDPSIYFRFCRDWAAIGCQVYGYNYGITWYGGNSGTSDGVVTNPRSLCRQGKITGCGVTGGFSGIWGTMGQGITVSTSSVYRCTDVGFDAEGCWDVDFLGNTATDCTTANYSTFYLNNNVNFVGNTSILTGAAGGSNHFQTNNASNAAYQNVGVRFNENICRAYNGVLGIIGDGGGAVQNLEMSRNQLRNSIIICKSTNAGSAAIEGNEYVFDQTQATAFDLINVSCFGNGVYGSAATSIKNNKVRSAISGAFPAGSIFVNVNDLDGNYTNRYELWENQNLSDNGPPIDMLLTSSGANAGMAPIFDLERNKFLNAYVVGLASGGLQVANPGAKASTVYMRDNRDRNGLSYPSNPTVASAAALALPIGADMCTVSGTTAVTSVAPAPPANTQITLLFSGILTFTNGNNLKLNGSFTTAAGSAITLKSDGTNLYEVGRN